MDSCSTAKVGLKSNEEIIEELTKDLESSCIKVDDNCASDVKEAWEKQRREMSGNDNDTCKFEKANSSETTKLPDDMESSESSEPPRDFVDEELLKDREIDLTESEKEALKEEAEKLKNQGNELFKNGEYDEAITVYTKGLQTCPLAYSKERSILFANRAAAKSKCLEKESAIEDCTKAIELNPTYIKVILRRGQLYKETDKLDEALQDYKTLNSLDPDNAEFRYEIPHLARQVEERNEKLKTEMLGKLKDLGNMVLKPFGLSTNNFELQKDPNSGGYSVKFHQNPS